MKITETKNEKNLAKIQVEVDRKEIDEHRGHVVDEMSKSVAVPGFRHGKAPKELAEAHLNPDKLTDHVLNHVLSDAVRTTLAEKKYRLFGKPVLEKIDNNKQEGWIIDLLFPLFPEVKIGEYKKLFSKTTKTKKSEVKTDDKTKSKTEDSKIDDIYAALIKGIEIDIPAPVIDEEINYSLERMANQAKSLNLSLESYLKATGKTVEEIKKEYRQSAEESLKLDLILLEIAKTEGITATNVEIDQLQLASGIPESQKDRIKTILERRKTIDFLLTL